MLKYHRQKQLGCFKNKNYPEKFPGGEQNLILIEASGLDLIYIIFLNRFIEKHINTQH